MLEKRSQEADYVCLATACAAGFASAANYTNHAPMVTSLASEFHFHLAAAGLLTTGLFLTHALMQVPGGYLADRFGPKPVLAFALAIIFAGNIGLGFATTYGQLLFWKVFIGVGTGASFVAGARQIAAIFAGPRLHVAQGFYGGSIVLGSGFVIFIIPALFQQFGWRDVFFLTAVLAGVALAIWMLLAPKAPVLIHKPASMAAMLANPQLWLLGLSQMASFGLVIVVGVWVTAYLSKTFQLPLERAGHIGSAVLVLGIVTRPLGGALVPRWGVKMSIQVGLVLNFIACLNFGLGGGSLTRAFVGILLLGLGCGLPYAAVFNRAAALYPARAGASMGAVNTVGIAMILAAPPLIGQMVEWSGSFQSSFLALGAFTIAVLLATLGIHTYEPDRSV